MIVTQKLSIQKFIFICLLLLLISTFYVNSAARGEKEFVFTRTYMEGGKPERTGTRRGRNEGEQLGIAGAEEYTWWQCQAIGLGWCDCVLGILVVGH